MSMYHYTQRGYAGLACSSSRSGSTEGALCTAAAAASEPGALTAEAVGCGPVLFLEDCCADTRSPSPDPAAAASMADSAGARGAVAAHGFSKAQAGASNAGLEMDTRLAATELSRGGRTGDAGDTAA